MMTIKNRMIDMKMMIDDELTGSEEQFEVENPATNEILGTVPLGRREVVEGAVGAADRAFGAWSGSRSGDRRAILMRIADMLDGHVDELTGLLVNEVGKPLVEARHEVRSSADVFREFAGMEVPDTTIKDDDSTLIYATRRPVGVSALILPWNYPLSVLSWKLASALLAGNTVVVKPSPYTPLNALRIGELIRDLVPRGVVNIISGDDETGKLLSEADEVKKIAFTGNMETGREIMRNAGGSLKRVSLELGGNDPAIVLNDFSMKNLSSLFWSSFRNAGQICIAVKRLYVHESLFGEFVDRYSEIASRVKVGYGMDEGVQMGPVNNPEQLAVVEDLVADARERGARIVTGGERIQKPGYFHSPTVVTDVCEDARIVREEQFGPVVPIIPYSDEEEALRRANSLEYGLGASIWTSDVERGHELARRVESGTVWVNTHMVVDPMAPFGGMKKSGLGRELGIWGLNEYVNMQTIYLKR